MKKLKFIFFVFLLFFSMNVSASTDTFDRTSDNNYGVNKNIKINSYNKNNVLNTPYVNASEKVYDFADILTDEEEESIYNSIDSFIKKTNMDMVFVSVDMPYSYDSQNEDFAADFYDYNDFGIDFKNYSGVILLRNNYESARYYGMYMFGDAQLYYDEGRYNNVLDSIYSDFVSKNYEEGIYTFVEMCNDYYDDGVSFQYRNSYIDENGFIQRRYSVPVFSCFVLSSIITLITMVILVMKNKMIKRASKASEYLNRNTINYSVNRDIFITTRTTSYVMSSSSGGSRGGSRGGSSGRGHSGGGRRG